LAVTYLSTAKFIIHFTIIIMRDEDGELKCDWDEGCPDPGDCRFNGRRGYWEWHINNCWVKVNTPHWGPNSRLYWALRHCLDFWHRPSPQIVQEAKAYACCGKHFCDNHRRMLDFSYHDRGANGEEYTPVPF